MDFLKELFDFGKRLPQWVVIAINIFGAGLLGLLYYFNHTVAWLFFAAWAFFIGLHIGYHDALKQSKK